MIDDLYDNSSWEHVIEHTPYRIFRMGFGWAFSIQRYGEWWRRHRRAMHMKFHPTASEVFKPVQIKYTRYNSVSSDIPWLINLLESLRGFFSMSQRSSVNTSVIVLVQLSWRYLKAHGIFQLI